MTRCSEILRQHILSLHGRFPSWTPPQIANELQCSSEIPFVARRTLLQIIRRSISRGTIEDKIRTGRKNSVGTPATIKQIKNLIKKKKKASIRNCQRILKEKNIKISIS